MSTNTSIDPPHIKGAPLVSDTLRSMRDAARTGDPIPAAIVAEWFLALRNQLFADQRPVRLEELGTGTPYWIQIDEQQWHLARKRGRPVRALYVHPLPGERSTSRRDHKWSADRTHCVVCNDPFDWAEAYCNPPRAPQQIPIKVQPFNPSWFLPALERLERALKRESKQERDKWNREIAQLRKSIEQHTKEKSP